MECNINHRNMTPDADTDTVLLNAVHNNDLDAVTDLLKLGANVHVNDDEAIKIAVSCGHAEMAQTLLERGADGSRAVECAVADAITLGHTDVMRVLIDAGVDMPIGVALIGAAHCGHADMARMLLSAGANVMKYGKMAIETATVNCHDDVVHVLAEAMAAANCAH